MEVNLLKYSWWILVPGIFSKAVLLSWSSQDIILGLENGDILRPYFHSLGLCLSLGYGLKRLRLGLDLCVQAQCSWSWSRKIGSQI